MQAQAAPPPIDEKTLQERIHAEVDIAVQSAVASCQALLLEKLLDRTRNMVSFEMTRVWDEVRQTKQQLRDARNMGTAADVMRTEVDGLRKELARVKGEVRNGLCGVSQELEEVRGGVQSKVRQEVEAGFGEVREGLEGVRKECGEAIAGLREEVERTREAIEQVQSEAGRPEEESGVNCKTQFGEARVQEEIAARLDDFKATNEIAMEVMRSRVEALESGRGFKSLGRSTAGGTPLAMRTQQIEADLDKLRQEVSELRSQTSETQKKLSAVEERSKTDVQGLREELAKSVRTLRDETASLGGPVNGSLEVFERLEVMRNELEQGLAKIERLEREGRASERALAQKVKKLEEGATGWGALKVPEDRPPSPTAEKAEAVASASKRTEDQLAKVEERIGLMLGLVSKGGAKGAGKIFSS
jgi:iron-sulfur cluster repair protein YtfE (RIC family)